VHRDPALHSHADGGDLRRRAGVIDPDPASSVDAFPVDTERSDDTNENVLESAHVRHDVDRLGETDQGVADELARSVPGDLPATVDIDDRRAVDGALMGRRACPGRVHGLVLEKEEGVAPAPLHDVGVEFPLERPAVAVGDQVGRHADRADLDQEDLRIIGLRATIRRG